jgi:hypothetical protein
MSDYCVSRKYKYWNSLELAWNLLGTCLELAWNLLGMFVGLFETKEKSERSEKIRGVG